jgi:hypothetical protein
MLRFKIDNTNQATAVDFYLNMYLDGVYFNKIGIDYRAPDAGSHAGRLSYFSYTTGNSGPVHSIAKPDTDTWVTVFVSVDGTQNYGVLLNGNYQAITAYTTSRSSTTLNSIQINSEDGTIVTPHVQEIDYLVVVPDALTEAQMTSLYSDYSEGQDIAGFLSANGLSPTVNYQFNGDNTNAGSTGTALPAITFQAPGTPDVYTDYTTQTLVQASKNVLVPPPVSLVKGFSTTNTSAVSYEPTSERLTITTGDTSTPIVFPFEVNNDEYVDFDVEPVGFVKVTFDLGLTTAQTADDTVITNRVSGVDDILPIARYYPHNVVSASGLKTAHYAIAHTGSLYWSRPESTLNVWGTSGADSHAEESPAVLYCRVTRQTTEIRYEIFIDAARTQLRSSWSTPLGGDNPSLHLYHSETHGFNNDTTRLYLSIYKDNVAGNAITISNIEHHS